MGVHRQIEHRSVRGFAKIDLGRGPQDGRGPTSVHSHGRRETGRDGISLAATVRRRRKHVLPIDLKQQEARSSLRAVLKFAAGRLVNAITEVLCNLLGKNVDGFLVVAILRRTIEQPLPKPFVSFEIRFDRGLELVPRQIALLVDQLFDRGETIRRVAHLPQDGSPDCIPGASR